MPPSYIRKNNYISSDDGATWDKQESEDGVPDPQDIPFKQFNRMNNYVWDELAEEWVPLEPF